MHTREEQLQAFDRLLTIMDELRVKCPWDKKQTFESLRQNTVEEANELAAAIIRKDMNEISKEVGDVLLHVVFYAKMGSETGDFDMADVCNRLCDKLIFRHPHVYGEVAAQNAEEVSHLWEQVKLKEKGGNKTVLGGIPDSLPSLIKAYRIQDKVANVGFDWEKKEDVWDKVKEEIGEFEAEMREQTNVNVNVNVNENVNENENVNANANVKREMTQEFGDLLFSLINVARLYKIKPDNALEMTNGKFTRRFNYIEQKAAQQGLRLQDMTIDEMETLWQEAKQQEKGVKE
ncbi:MAG: nucleoside triphosphate pyrophosphohydrolase [Bacteroidales bacterium]|nr:nucleoside triphosphate pyrophosphohydrolase [Candidatus Colicola caccequi]